MEEEEEEEEEGDKKEEGEKRMWERVKEPESAVNNSQVRVLG